MSNRRRQQPSRLWPTVGVLCFIEALIIAFSYSWVFSILGYISGLIACIGARYSATGYLPAGVFGFGMVIIHGRNLTLLWPWTEPYQDWTYTRTVVGISLNIVGAIFSIVLLVCAIAAAKGHKQQKAQVRMRSPRRVGPVHVSSYPPTVLVPRSLPMYNQPIVIIQSGGGGPPGSRTTYGADTGGTTASVLQPAGVAYLPHTSPETGVVQYTAVPVHGIAPHYSQLSHPTNAMSEPQRAPKLQRNAVTAVTPNSPRMTAVPELSIMENVGRLGPVTQPPVYRKGESLRGAMLTSEV